MGGNDEAETWWAGELHHAKREPLHLGNDQSEPRWKRAANVRANKISRRFNPNPGDFVVGWQEGVRCNELLAGAGTPALGGDVSVHLSSAPPGRSSIRSRHRDGAWAQTSVVSPIRISISATVTRGNGDYIMMSDTRRS